MGLITWCKEVKNGLYSVSPNPNLQEGYLRKAEVALETSREVSNTEWKIATLYYCLYFSLYSVLMRIGIKSQNHTCTIAFAKEFLDDIFSTYELSLFDKALALRKDSQYYVDRSVDDTSIRRLFDAAPQLYVKCKQLNVTSEYVGRIRWEFNNEGRVKRNS